MNYHDYGSIVTEFNRQTYEFSNYPCFVVSDQPPMRDQKDGPCDIEEEVASGSVKRADTLAGLAASLGIDPRGLEEQVEIFNEHAQKGQDPHFHRGEAPYDLYRKLDASLPNRALRPLKGPPYYGQQVTVKAFGTKGGPLLNVNAQVRGAQGDPIPGLYACGNVAASVFGLAYPGGGATIGQAAVFGMIAGRHSATR
jgi:hypothetical protein